MPKRRKSQELSQLQKESACVPPPGGKLVSILDALKASKTPKILDLSSLVQGSHRPISNQGKFLKINFYNFV